MNINWYPGHMNKTREDIKKKLSMVDLVIEILDARAPLSSRNPIMDEIIGQKPRIIALNKSDLSDDKLNKEWLEYFKVKTQYVYLLDSNNFNDVKKLMNLSNEIMSKQNQKDLEKGVISRPTRVMIVGIPNVGKSTLINTMVGKKGARVGNKPGITRNSQWIKTRGKLELLDTPGILWPKFEDKNIGLNLAFIGSIKDEILDRETLALRLIERLIELYPSLIEKRYSLSIGGKLGLEIMEEIALKRGCIISGGEVDYTRVANLILDEFRKGKIGRISLESPKENLC